MIHESTKFFKLFLIGHAVDRVLLLRIHLQLKGPTALLLEGVLDFDLPVVYGRDALFEPVKENGPPFRFPLKQSFPVEKHWVVRDS